MGKTITRVKVDQMTSPTSWKPVANQFVITTPEGQYFQSYQSLVAFRDNEENVTLDETYWDYSRTTGKYRNEFLGEGIEETREKIKSGEYALADLNIETGGRFIPEFNRQAKVNPHNCMHHAYCEKCGLKVGE